MSTLTEVASGYRAGRTLPLRVELVRQLKRRRTGGPDGSRKRARRAVALAKGVRIAFGMFNGHRLSGA